MTPDRDECESIQQQLGDLRAGCLDERARNHVEQHLHACDRCRAEQAWDNRLVELLRVAPRAEPSRTLLTSVRARIDHRRRRVWFTAIGSLAALLIVGTVISVFWQPLTHRQTIVASHSQRLPVEVPIESAILFEPPPVVSFEILAREQGSYVAVMHRLGKE